MSWKGAAFLVVMAIGLPLFIFYTIFFQNPRPEMQPIPGFEEFDRSIRELVRSDYRVLDVRDEGVALRINVELLGASENRRETQMRTTNILYDIQTLVGKDLSVSVWAYRTGSQDRADLEGMVFYHSLTDQTVFKTSEELQ